MMSKKSYQLVSVLPWFRLFFMISLPVIPFLSFQKHSLCNRSKDKYIAHKTLRGHISCLMPPHSPPTTARVDDRIRCWNLGIRGVGRSSRPLDNGGGGGGGAGLQKKFFRPFGPQFGLKIRGAPFPWICHWNQWNYVIGQKEGKDSPAGKFSGS